jgi:H+/Cl- antiporter ClcA
VRAPLAVIVLVIEMTGDSAMILPLLSGCFGAMLVAELLREPSPDFSRGIGASGA